MAEERIDIEKSNLRSFALFAGAWGIVALAGVLLWVRPKGAEPGSFNELILYVGLVFFGLCAIVGTIRLFRRGPVVSVGREGVFDRRLSTGWIPWDAITAVGTAETNRQKSLVLAVDPTRDAELPITKGARRMAKLNAAAMGVTGYWITATELSGGFRALDAAVSRFHPRASDSTTY